MVPGPAKGKLAPPYLASVGGLLAYGTQRIAEDGSW